MVAAFAAPSWASRARGRAARSGRAVLLALSGALASGVLGVALAGDAATSAWAGDASTAPPPAGDLAEALRAVTVRMELALEKARWLQARGRRDEALAALDDALKLHDEIHARWRAASAAGAVPPPPATGARSPRRLPLPPRDVADAAAIDAARRYLLDRQRPDGHFAEPLERIVERDPEREGARQEVETGLVVAALCDLAGQRPLDAIRGAASALARASASREGPLHPIAAWGLASALTHLDEPLWRGEVLRAVVAVLDAADEEAREGARRDAPAAPPVRVVDRAWACVLLHEVLPMAGPSLAQRIEGRLLRWRFEARRETATPDAAPEVRAARDLVAGLRVGDEGAHVRETPATSPSVYLSGSVLVFHLAAHDGVEALARARAAQVREGPDAGSWPPRPAVGLSGGRIAQTALHLLASLMPYTAFVSPATTGLGE